MAPIRKSSNRSASASMRYTTPYPRTERVMWPDPVPFRGVQQPSHRKPRHMSYSYEGQTYGNWDASARNHELGLPSRRKTTNHVNMRNIQRGQNMYHPANRLEQTYHPSLIPTSSWLATPNFTVPLPRIDYMPVTEPSAALPGFINQNANTIPRISHEYAPTSRSRYTPATIPPQTGHHHNHGINRDLRYQAQRTTLPSYLPQMDLSLSTSRASSFLPSLAELASLPRSCPPPRNFGLPLPCLLPSPGDASTSFSGNHHNERQHEQQLVSIIDWKSYDERSTSTESPSAVLPSGANTSFTPFEQDLDVFYAHGRGVHVFNTPISRTTVRAAEAVTAVILPSYQGRAQREYLEWESLKQEQEAAMEKINHLIQLDEDFGARLPTIVVGAQDAMEELCETSLAPTSLPSVDSQIPTFAEMLEDTSWL